MSADAFIIQIPCVQLMPLSNQHYLVIIKQR